MWSLINFLEFCSTSDKLSIANEKLKQDAQTQNDDGTQSTFVLHMTQVRTPSRRKCVSW